MRQRSRLESESEIKAYLYDLLSRREYSRAQLLVKLGSRCDDSALVERLLDQFAEAGYQSDQRFAESQIRHRRQQGYGIRKISFELQQKGIDAALVESLLCEADQDSRQDALAYVQRKYADRAIKDDKERARRFRHLMSRGFSYDDIHFALKHQIDDDYEL